APKIGRLHKANAKKWQRARQAVQYTALAFFLIFVGLTLTGTNTGAPINLFSRMNPLQALVAMVGGREPILNYWPALITVAATLLVGRVWCGWFCPLGAVLELFGRTGRFFRWQNLRRLKYVILFVVIVMAA